MMNKKVFCFFCICCIDPRCQQGQKEVISHFHMCVCALVSARIPCGNRLISFMHSWMDGWTRDVCFVVLAPIVDVICF